MTAPTHAAFGLLWAAIASTGQANAIACTLGALLPDIDHPQSAMGRLFFFISYPLNSRFGHRGLIHGFAIWSAVLAAGIFTLSPVIKWVAIGAISHILMDTYTISGVRALLPFSERSVVCFRKDWRIYTGSVHEIIVFILIAAMIMGANYSHAIGGPRKLINLLVKSHRITVEEYTRAGLAHCTVSGRFRWSSGRLEDVEWVVVGLEGKRMVYWNGEYLVKDGIQGKFIRSVLKQTERNWPVVRVDGFCTVNEPSFWFDSRSWYFAKTGDIAMGSVKAVDGNMPAISSAGMK